MKAANLINVFLRLLVFAIMGMAGVSKIMGAEDPVRIFTELGMEPTGRYVIGLLECASALLLLPHSTVARGALLSLAVLTGALLAHLNYLGFGGTYFETSILWGLGFFGSLVLVFMNGTQIDFIKRALGRE